MIRSSSRKVSNVIWGEYLDVLALAWEGLRNESFERTRNVIGVLPAVMVYPLRTAIEAAPIEAYLAGNHTRFAVAGTYKDEDVASLTAGNRFMALDGRTRWAIHPVINYLGNVLQGVLGCKWRILHVRSWIASHGAENGPYGWHTDAMPEQMLKLMIYCNEMGGDYGGLEVDTGGGKTQEITGPAGTWVLFYNSLLLHRGIPPRKPGLHRTAMEITLVPWVRFALHPRSLGVNGKHPAFPLMNDLEGL